MKKRNTKKIYATHNCKKICNYEFFAGYPIACEGVKELANYPKNHYNVVNN